MRTNQTCHVTVSPGYFGYLLTLVLSIAMTSRLVTTRLLVLAMLLFLFPKVLHGGNIAASGFGFQFNVRACHSQAEIEGLGKA